MAEEADLDLVEMAPNQRPPVCKLMDYGKFKYESDQKRREARRNQVQTVIKEMKLRPKIDPHDYETKKGHVVRFLKAGDKVKITIMFRGREQSRPELGFRLLQRLAADIDELGYVEASPKQDGRNMTMVVAPHKRPSGSRAEPPTPARFRVSPHDPHHPTDERSRDIHAQGQAPQRCVASASGSPAPARSCAAARTATTCSSTSPASARAGCSTRSR